MRWHCIMIPNEILRLIRRHHKTRNFKLATKICDDLYKEIKYSDINFDEVMKNEKINKDTYILEIIEKAREWQKTKSISTSSNVCKMLNLLANEYLDK